MKHIKRFLIILLLLAAAFAVGYFIFTWGAAK